MRAIALSAVLAVIATALAYADAHDDVMDVFAKMTSALTGARMDGAGSIGGNVAEFMSVVSKQMPDYDTLKSNVTALVNGAEISSSVTPINEEEHGQTYKVDLDWVMDVRSLVRDGPLVRRREVVHCELRKEKKHWKVVSLKPINFFAAANLGGR
jgi:hypothetical protein